jgi:hypothetical protein
MHPLEEFILNTPPKKTHPSLTSGGGYGRDSLPRSYADTGPGLYPHPL